MNRYVTSNWFVAQYKPNSFFVAKKNLENQGIETFLPLIEMTKRKAARFLTELKPLFPGYIFISFNVQNFEWRSINNTVGLSRLIVLNNIPQTIPETFISSLKLRCDYKGKLMTGNKVTVGRKVEVLKGPFAKMIGSVEKIDPQERVTLLFEILGRKTKTTVSNSEVKIVR